MAQKEDMKIILEKAWKIRRHILEITTMAESGHPGGSLSCADVIAALYFKVMRHDPNNPKWVERDRFILSKGHAAPALYAALAEAGYFPLDELKNFRKTDSILQGHPDKKRTPGIENSSGSLGMGLSIANGIALAGKYDKKNYRVYVLLGDGECDEGMVWEAAMTSAHYRLDNLTAIIDRNGLQIDGPTEKIMSLEPLMQKWKSFGWHVIEIEGHDIGAILNAFEEAKKVKRMPAVIIAHLIKGKGIPFMEWIKDYHGKPVSQEMLKEALSQIDHFYEETMRDKE